MIDLALPQLRAEGCNRTLVKSGAAYCDGSGLGVADGEDHGDTAAILGVFRVKFDQVSLFKLNRDVDVSGGADGEDQVRDGHHGRCPEHQEPTHVEGVADDAVESWSAEGEVGVGDAAEIQPDL